jgi:hypothetical protein
MLSEWLAQEVPTLVLRQQKFVRFVALAQVRVSFVAQD